MAGLVGKVVTLFWNDNGRVVPKEGEIISEGVVFVEIRTIKGVEAIPTGKIVRVQVRQ